MKKRIKISESNLRSFVKNLLNENSEQLKCQNCGAIQNNLTAKFCVQCGTRIIPTDAKQKIQDTLSATLTFNELFTSVAKLTFEQSNMSDQINVLFSKAMQAIHKENHSGLKEIKDNIKSLRDNIEDRGEQIQNIVDRMKRLMPGFNPPRAGMDLKEFDKYYEIKLKSLEDFKSEIKKSKQDIEDQRKVDLQAYHDSMEKVLIPHDAGEDEKKRIRDLIRAEKHETEEDKEDWLDYMSGFRRKYGRMTTPEERSKRFGSK